MRKKYFLNASIIDPKNSIDEIGGIIIDEFGKIGAIGKKVNKNNIPSREKFVDLANKRVTSAIDKIRLIGNLSDRRFYEYSEKDSKQIIDALSKELNSVKSKFQNNAKKKDKEFSLDL